MVLTDDTFGEYQFDSSKILSNIPPMLLENLWMKWRKFEQTADAILVSLY